MPWSRGCQCEVVLGGSHIIRTFDKPSRPLTSSTPKLWPEKLSSNNKTFLPSIFLLNYCRNSSQITPVIYFVLLYRYITRRRLRSTFFKACGFLYLLINHSSSILVLSLLQVKATVQRSLLFLVLWLDSVAKVSLGVIFQNNLDSSILKVS